MTRKFRSALNMVLQGAALMISIYLLYMFFWLLGLVLEVL